MAPVLNRSPLATTCFSVENTAHLRVYYQDAEGNIKEAYYDDQVGWNTRRNNVVGKGKLNTGMAAVSWNSGMEIRVYFLSPKNQLVERCYTQGKHGNTWYDGSLTTKQKFMAAPYSQVAAVGFGSDLDHLRVYYQDTTNHVCEVVLDTTTETWSTGTKELPVAVPGTSITALATTVLPDGLLWVYFQLPDMQLVEWRMDPNGDWSLGGFTCQGTYAPRAYVSAVAWGKMEVRVFAVNDANLMTLTSWTKNAWQKTVELSTVITDSAVAAVKVTTMPDWLRVYYQPLGAVISELGSNDGGVSWVTTQQTIPIGD